MSISTNVSAQKRNFSCANENCWKTFIYWFVEKGSRAPWLAPHLQIKWSSDSKTNFGVFCLVCLQSAIK